MQCPARHQGSEGSASDGDDGRGGLARHRRNGRAAIYQSVKLPLRDQSGEIYAMCGISNDITERKQAEERLRQEQDFLRRLIRAH